MARSLPNRRRFIQFTGLLAAGFQMRPCGAAATPDEPLATWLHSSDFDTFVKEKMEMAHVLGASIAVVDKGRVVFSTGIGSANVQGRWPMTSETIINIASVTKTITCAAVMQLFERGKFALDDDVNAFLPFPVHNPDYPVDRITFRQLLTHTSSIGDGPSYGDSYACGDPQTPLGTWLRDYLTPSGTHFDRASNFHKWAPGKQYSYSNVAFGLLGFLVERLSGVGYAQYCDENIFSPLRMNHTGFFLSRMNHALYATPYSYMKVADFPVARLLDASWARPMNEKIVEAPLCLYSYPTLADGGGARSSASDLGSFLAMWVGGGSFNGVRILREDTVALVLSDQIAPEVSNKGQRQGLTWVEYPSGIWGKYGSDPGIATLAKFRLSDRRGVVILTNSDQGEAVTNAIAKRVFEYPA